MPGGQRGASVSASEPLGGTLKDDVEAAADHSFPRSARLTRRGDFDRVLRRPEHRIRVGALRCSLAGNGRCRARLGIIVAKRHMRLASRRNQVKRSVREWFRTERSTLAGVDMVIQLTGIMNVRDCRATLAEIARRLPERYRVAAEDDTGDFG